MNIKKSLRIIFRNKIYSILNITGLAIGITAASLIFLWVESKVNFNMAIPGSKNLYIAGAHYKANSGEISSSLITGNPLGVALSEDFPEIKRSTRYTTWTRILTPENTTHSFEEDGAYADAALFDMIGMTFISGLPSSAFDTMNAIVISESMSRKIYGADNPMGKGLIQDGTIYEVAGVFKDLPENTAFEFEWLMPFRLLYDEMKPKFSVDAWGTSWMANYVEMEEGVSIFPLNDKLKGLAQQKAGAAYENTDTFLYPLNRVLLYGDFKDGMETGGGYIRTVRLFFLIGVLILLIACINFMNLSTARSQKRAMEVGVRKTFGTKRKYLIRQFLGESGLITGIALILSIGLTALSLPLFNGLIDGKLSLNLANPYILMGLLAIGIFCTLIAGCYPALYLSSFNPVTTLKMQKAGKRGVAVWVRQGLVVFQFTMAFILICSTYVIYLQIRLVQNRDIGIDKENLVSFPVTAEIRDSYASVLNELENSNLVASCGFSEGTLLYSDMSANPWFWNGKDPKDDEQVCYFFISESLIDAAGIKLIEGTDVSPAHDGVLINATLAKRMGEEGRLGGRLWQNTNKKLEIAGIVKDFVFGDPYAIEYSSAILVRVPHRANHLFVRMRPEADMYEAISKIQSILKTFTPYHTFEPTFMTYRFDRMFAEDRFVEKLSALFAILAIFISCLGLLGLSTFSAEQRTKEIGIRKVLGARVTDILGLLGKSYMILLLISFGIGIPISIYIASLYLRDYAFRIVLDWDIFVGVAVLIAIIALLTVSVLSLRAAIANPVKSIKTE